MLADRELAMFYAWVGHVDETLEWLERGVTWSHGAVWLEIIRSGVFDRVREDSAFQAGLEGMRERIRERLLQAVEG